MIIIIIYIKSKQWKSYFSMLFNAIFIWSSSSFVISLFFIWLRRFILSTPYSVQTTAWKVRLIKINRTKKILSIFKYALTIRFLVIQKLDWSAAQEWHLPRIYIKIIIVIIIIINSWNPWVMSVKTIADRDNRTLMGNLMKDDKKNIENDWNSIVAPI